MTPFRMPISFQSLYVKSYTEIVDLICFR